MFDPPAKAGGQYTYLHRNGRIVIDDALTRQTRADLARFVEVWYDDRRVHYGTYDMAGATTVSRLVKAAKETAGAPSMPWQEWITWIVYDVIERWREGEPAIRLHAVKPGKHGWLLDRLIGDVGATSIIAAGGSLKSMLAMAAALTVASGNPGILGLKPHVTGPVLYLDWEADADTHADRLHALTRPIGNIDSTGIVYRQEHRPLRSATASLARLVDTLEVAMIVVDSVMLARGGDAFGPEDTVAMFAALREINRPALLVDHKSKATKATKGAGAYGSVVNENSVRLAWEAELLDLGERDTYGLNLSMYKSNNVGRISDHTWMVTFSNGTDPKTIHFDLTSHDELEAGVTQERRMLHHLMLHGPATTSELAAALHLTPEHVRSLAGRLGRQIMTRKQGRENLWLLEGDQEELPDAF